MELINSFAVVAYVCDPVAKFVDSLRRELTPGCCHRAHVTVLPPRPLWIPTDDGIEKARSILASFEPFELAVDGVTTFESTHVVKLSLKKGLSELYTLHDILNTGPFERSEEYNYVPHITLCHDLSDKECESHYEVARKRFAEFAPPSIWIDTLTFVQQKSNGNWADLADLALGMGKHAPVRVRR